MHVNISTCVYVIYVVYIYIVIMIVYIYMYIVHVNAISIHMHNLQCHVMYKYECYHICHLNALCTLHVHM